MKKLERLRLDAIRLDGGTQMRERIHQDKVGEYAELYREEVELPPIIVFFDGVNYWLGDGFHRYFASEAAGFKDIEAEVRSGTQRDAVRFSWGANGHHGLPRTRADRRKAVLSALDDSESSEWSNRKIAELCEVSHTFVNQIKREMEEPKAPKESKDKVEGVKVGDVVETLPVDEAAPKSDKVETFPMDDGPSEEEMEAARLREEADRKLIDDMLESDDVMKTLHEQVKNLTHINANLQTRINVLMREKNAAVDMVKDLQKQIKKAKK